MYRLNTTSAYYKASIKTQIQHNNSTNTQKQYGSSTKKKQYKQNTGTTNLNPEKQIN